MRRVHLLLVVSIILFLFSLWRQTNRDVAEISEAASMLETTEAQINRLAAGGGEHPEVQAQLGLLWLQWVRETGDVSGYLSAETAFTTALDHDPQQIDALVGMGTLALARHDFVDALAWADKAERIGIRRADILGVQVDALVELGRYDEAIAVADAMVNIKPSLNSYSRISYLRELHGDVDGAIEAMEFAANAGAPTHENTLWTLTQLGNLHFNRGDLDSAATIYEHVLSIDPTYPYALAGMGRIQAGQDEVWAAIATYESLVARFPMPAFVQTLGELYVSVGEMEAAETQFALIDALWQISQDAGMDVDLEMIIFALENGTDPHTLLPLAEETYARRPGIFSADMLAWTLYHTGDYDQAWHYAQEALKLDTQDALLHYHAGMIALALNKPAFAQHHLETALTINPYFSIKYVPQLHQILENLQ